MIIGPFDSLAATFALLLHAKLCWDMCERCCTEELEWRPLNRHGGRLAAPNYDLGRSYNYGKVGFERRQMRQFGV